MYGRLSVLVPVWAPTHFLTHVIIGMRRTLLITLVLGLFAITAAAQDITVPDDYSTIQAALDNASPGDDILIKNGNYSVSNQINGFQTGITLRGESQSGVVIDATSVTGWALLVDEGNDNVTLKNFTILGGGDETIKTNFLTGLSIEDVTAEGSAGSEIDLNNVKNSTLTNVTADGDGTPGVGFALTGVEDITLSNVTTTGNNWGGVGIFDTDNTTSDGDPPVVPPTGWTLILSPTDIEITGSTFNESVSVYTDNEFGNGIGDLILPNFNFTVENPVHRDRAEDFVFYKKNKDDAVALALGLNNPPAELPGNTTNSASYIQTLTRDGSGVVSQEDNFIVGTSDGTAMSVQTAVSSIAPGGTVNVLPGTYNETVTVETETTLQSMSGTGGSSATTAKAAPAGAPTINGQVILNASGATLDGFVVSPPPATTNLTGEAIRIGNGADNVTVQNNTVQDFTEDDLGEDVGGIVAFGTDGDAVENVTITNNLVQRVTREEDGDILGAVGISIQGNVQGATVSNNTVQKISDGTAGYAFGIVVRGSRTVSAVPSGVNITGNTIQDILSDPASIYAGVGFGVEEGTVASVSGNTLSNTELQAEDKTFNLDLSSSGGFIANNTLDRAVIIRDGSSDGIKDETNAQRVYSTISAPVSRAVSGETVEVFGFSNSLTNEYGEDVDVSTSLTITGTPAPTAKPVTKSFDLAVSNVTVQGFKITGGTTSANQNVVVGIYARGGTSGHTLTENTLAGPGSGTTSRGVLTSSSGVTSSTISNSDFSEWTTGVFLNPGASDFSITGNSFKNTTAGIGSDGISDVSITQNLFTDNTEGFGSGSVGTNVSANDNCFLDNDTDVKQDGGEIINAQNNWWGTDGPNTTGSVNDSNPKSNPISGIEGCGSDGTCPTPTVPTQTQQAQSLEVTFSGGGNSEGVTSVNFIDDQGDEALNNYEVDQAPNGYTTSNDILYEFNGSNQDAPEEVTFTLNAVPPVGTQPGESFQASYFAIITNACGETFNADPVLQVKRPGPTTLALEGNYPNPFRGQTTIAFELPAPDEVTVSVYDILGRKVATLVDGSLGAGVHEVQWDGTSDRGKVLSSGVYLYRLEVGTTQKVRRMTLVR
jgi:hypothetical protein